MEHVTMTRKSCPFALVLAVAFLTGSQAGVALAHGPNGHGAEKPAVYFINLEDGQTVESPVTIQFGLENYGIAPAGIDIPGTGHHHLLIDVSLSEEDRQYSIPEDENHLHFCKGQTQTTLDLEPGTYALQLVLGDANHVPFSPSIESPILTITVE